MPAITTHRHGITTTWSEVIRSGKRLTKTRTAAPGRTCYEYWGYPVRGVGMHKLGQFYRGQGKLRIRALRNMQVGTQLQEFATVREAEDWIAQCDAWGELERCSVSASAEH